MVRYQKNSITPNNKSSEDLLDDLQNEDIYEEDLDSTLSQGQSVPYDKAFSMLTKTRGEHLEMMGRVTPKMMIYMHRSSIRDYLYGGDYEIGRRNQSLRISISKDGHGREEMIATLNTGQGVVPGEFYSNPDGFQMGGNSGEKRSYVELPYDDAE